LFLDLLRVGMVLMERFGGGEEVSLTINERRHRAPAGDRSPAVVLPLGVEREMNADGDVRMSLDHLYRLLIPGRREHHRYGDGKATFDESLERHVDAVTHAGVIASDDQIRRIRRSRPRRALRRALRSTHRLGRWAGHDETA